MTKKYRVAVLLPTRGRTDALARSVYSVIDNAIEPDKIQVLLAFDRDDNIGLDYFNSQLKVDLEKRNINFVAISFNRLGYVNLHKYYNEMAKHADADWMFMWNDDAYMNTHGWDKIVKKYNGRLRVLKIHTHNDHPYSIFPIVPSAWLDVLGYLTGHHMIDAWVSQIAYMTDLIEIVDIYVTHDRHDLTGNNEDATFKERVTLEGRPHDPADFHHTINTQLRMAECEKLSKYMASQGMSTAWWESVKAGAQDPWAKLKQHDINHQMVQFHMKVDHATNQVNFTPAV